MINHLFRVLYNIRLRAWDQRDFDRRYLVIEPVVVSGEPKPVQIQLE